MAYWAHLLYPHPLDPSIRDQDDPLYLAFPYSASSGEPVEPAGTLRKKILDYVDDGIDKLFMNEDGSFNFAEVGDRILRHFFRDLDIYYTATCKTRGQEGIPVRQVIQRQLLDLLSANQGNQILLIAHSMGSIIAYDTLMQAPPDIKIDTLVTIGSPLGLPVIHMKIKDMLKAQGMEVAESPVPGNITSNWYNLSDLRDRVAIDYRLADDFSTDPYHVQVIDLEVQNDYVYKGEENPHEGH